MTFYLLIVSRVALMASHVVDHFDERAMDIIEKVLHDLFVRAIKMKGSTDVELPAFQRAGSRNVADLRAERAAATPLFRFP